MRVARAHEPEDLLRQARPRGERERLAAVDDRVVHVRRDAEVELSGELDRAQDAHGVLAEARLGVADRVHDAPLDVGHAADPIEDLLPLEIVEQRVDREVAAHGVLGRLAEDVVAADEDVLVGVVARGRVAGVLAERRDLDHLAALEEDVHEPEAPADDARVAEELAHLLGARARRHVEVLRPSVEQEIADAAADEVGLEPVSHEAPEHLLHVGVDAALFEHDVVPDRRDGARDERGRPNGCFGEIAAGGGGAVAVAVAVTAVATPAGGRGAVVITCRAIGAVASTALGGGVVLSTDRRSGGVDVVVADGERGQRLVAGVRARVCGAGVVGRRGGRATHRISAARGARHRSFGKIENRTRASCADLMGPRCGRSTSPGARASGEGCPARAPLGAFVRASAFSDDAGGATLAAPTENANLKGRIAGNAVESKGRPRVCRKSERNDAEKSAR